MIEMALDKNTSEITGLLFSGGLDSAVLLAQLLEQGQRVQPFYVRTGCRWEDAERKAIEHFMDALNLQAVEAVVELEVPIADLYGLHWSVTGVSVPDENTLDEAVSLWGRNPLLLIKPALWCQQHGIEQLAMATLASNPFADTTPEFFLVFEQMLEAATTKRLKILRPFAGLSKQEVLAKGSHLPLELTFSCLAPIREEHCGHCNKCAERGRVLSTLSKGKKHPCFA